MRKLDPDWLDLCELYFRVFGAPPMIGTEYPEGVVGALRSYIDGKAPRGFAYSLLRDGGITIRIARAYLNFLTSKAHKRPKS